MLILIPTDMCLSQPSSEKHLFEAIETGQMQRTDNKMLVSKAKTQGTSDKQKDVNKGFSVPPCPTATSK